MADTAGSGVVNDRGQVFSGTSGSAVYEGLYVSDGAVIPRPLGVKPVAHHLCARRADLRAPGGGAGVDDRTTGCRRPHRPAWRSPSTWGRIHGAYVGLLLPNEEVDFQRGYTEGKADQTTFAFILTIESEDVERLIEDPRHPARMVGTVQAPSLSDKPFTVTDGVFNLFEVDPSAPENRRMDYAMRLTQRPDGPTGSPASSSSTTAGASTSGRRPPPSS